MCCSMWYAIADAEHCLFDCQLVSLRNCFENRWISKMYSMLVADSLNASRCITFHYNQRSLEITSVDPVVNVGYNMNRE